MFFGFSKSDYCSLDFLCSIFSEKNLTLSKSSLHEKIKTSAAVDFMRNILERLCAECMPTITEHAGRECKFSAIRVVDSTEIKLSNKLENFKNTQNGPRCKLQTLLDLCNNTVSYKITKGNENDQGYKDYLESVEKDNLIMFDLGYFCLSSLKQISSKEAKFVSRLPKSVRVMELNGKKINLNKRLQNSNGKIDIKVLVGIEAKLECRLVAKKLKGKALKNRKAKLKRDAKRRKRSFSKGERPLEELDLWSIYITNLQKETIDGIHTLYILRWQIELFFKVLKSKLSLRYVKYPNEYMAMIAIYSKLIAMTIMMILTQSIDDIEISFYKSIEFFKYMIKELYSAITSYALKKCEEFLFKVRRFAKKEQRKTRPSSLTKARLYRNQDPCWLFGYSLARLCA